MMRNCRLTRNGGEFSGSSLEVGNDFLIQRANKIVYSSRKQNPVQQSQFAGFTFPSSFNPNHPYLSISAETYTFFKNSFVLICPQPGV